MTKGLLFLDYTHIPKTYHLTPECMEQDVENTSVLVNMDEAETDKERDRGQLTDKEGRWEVGKNRKKRVERETSGKNAGWKDEGIKGKRWGRGSAHGKYAV